MEIMAGRPIVDLAFKESLHQYLLMLPSLLVALVGIVLALVFIRRHLGVSVLVVAGLLLYMLNGLIGTFLYHYFTFKKVAVQDVEGIQQVHFWAVLGMTSVEAVALVLLLIALFCWRAGARREVFGKREIEEIIRDPEIGLPPDGIRRLPDKGFPR